MLVQVWGLTRGWGGTEHPAEPPSPWGCILGPPRLYPQCFLLSASCFPQPRLSHLQQHSPVSPSNPRGRQPASLTHTGPLGGRDAEAGNLAGHTLPSCTLAPGFLCGWCVEHPGPLCWPRRVLRGLCGPTRLFSLVPGRQDDSNHQNNKAFEFQPENARNLREAETLLKDLFLDVDRAKQLKHPQATEIEKE